MAYEGDANILMLEDQSGWWLFEDGSTIIWGYLGYKMKIRATSVEFRDKRERQEFRDKRTFVIKNKK